MGIDIKLDAFEGPLDLLLHLIDKNKLNIYDIPIVEITAQYMEIVKAMTIKDLDLMSEFLVMAALLVQIKSKMLLPKEEKEEEGAEEDPRQELVERLLEYKMYKYVSYELKDRQLSAEQMLFKQETMPEGVTDYEEEVDPMELLSGVTLTQLNRIFRLVMKRQVDKIDPIRSTFGKIEREDFSLSDRIADMEEYGKTHKTFRFRTLLESVQGKMAVIVTFLAVLELIKVGRITVLQEELFEDIEITYHENVSVEPMKLSFE